MLTPTRERPPSQNTEVVLSGRLLLPKSRKSAVVVSINRPDRLNCFDTEVCHRLAQIFNDIAEEILQYDLVIKSGNPDGNEDDGGFNSPIAAVIFTGQGPSFCAGADLSDPPNPLEQSSDLPHYLRLNPTHQMSRIGVPIIGALKGHVITGGFELALGCDILIGDPTTIFRDTHVKFGLAPCWGLSQKLSQRISPGRAKIISFSAKALKAETAYEWGLLDELVDESPASLGDEEFECSGGIKVENDDYALLRALELADMIGCNDSVMVRRYKRAIVEGAHVDFGKGLQRERELGLAHYLEVVGDGSTFEGAKVFITDGSRPRTVSSKL
mmetsp:Transcript_2016/g.4359  ORF Transcript_2016/g.4359 Transcript_2016/m.4359 type:complete len:328 (+) Transcript_2016:56-1039(+)